MPTGMWEIDLVDHVDFRTSCSKGVTLLLGKEEYIMDIMFEFMMKICVMVNGYHSEVTI